MAHLLYKMNNNNWIFLQQKIVLIKGQDLPLAACTAATDAKWIYGCEYLREGSVSE